MSAAKMDAQLLQMDSGVELALDRAKAWSKYAKDVIIYIEKRTQLGKTLLPNTHLDEKLHSQHGYTDSLK